MNAAEAEGGGIPLAEQLFSGSAWSEEPHIPAAAVAVAGHNFHCSGHEERRATPGEGHSAQPAVIGNRTLNTEQSWRAGVGGNADCPSGS